MSQVDRTAWWPEEGEAVKEMAKRLMALVGMLALLMTTAVPALAQEQQQYAGGEDASATGVLIEGLPQDVGGFGTHSIEDEATGTLYALRSAGASLDSHAGQRVTVYGALTPGKEGTGEGGFEGGGTLPSIDVTRVESADGPIESGATPCDEFLSGGEPNPDYDPSLPECAAGDGITATFELTVAGEPPVGTTFFGLVGQQPTRLTDPDGDGAYEGVLTLSADFGTFPIPVAIVSGDPANPQGVIKDFGEVVIEDGDVFSADYSFDGPPPGSSATFTYELAVECQPPAGAEFLGLTATESLVTTPLTDPDGDGVYTGSQNVPKFAPGGPQEEPITLSPVRIVQGPSTGTGPLGPEYRVIKDFGTVVAEDATLSASVSFCGGTGDGNGGNGPGPAVSGDTNNNEGSISKIGIPEGGAVSDGGVRMLPETGGAALVLAVALLLTGAGLLMRRVTR